VAFEILELGVDCCCHLCECCFELANARGRERPADGTSAASADTAAKQARRNARAEKRGFALVFEGRRIANIRFLRGAAEGRIASAMSERDLLRLVAAEPRNRPLRLAVSRYLRNKRRGRVAPPPPIIERSPL
jgi:hypothetical protein